MRVKKGTKSPQTHEECNESLLDVIPFLLYDSISYYGPSSNHTELSVCLSGNILTLK